MRRLLEEKHEAATLRCLLASGTPRAAAGDFLGEVPLGWSTGRLKDVAVRIDVGIAEAATHAYADSGVPLIRSTNIRPGTLLTDDLLHITPQFALRNRAKTVHADDILTVRTGNPGVSAVVPDRLDGCQTFTQLITTLRAPHLPAYFCAWLNAQAARRYFESFAWGSAQRNISIPILANVPVPMPPVSDQASALDRMEKELAPMTAMRDELDRHAALLQERRRAVITAALPAPIDVPGIAV
jgi:type I restriction enzyme S subunit